MQIAETLETISLENMYEYIYGKGVWLISSAN